jgi:Mlc titration factor MtfA (ptsG expression regulator)/Tfp pilus assembly protein PilF
MSSSLEEHTPIPPFSQEAFPQAWLPYLHENVFLYGLLSEKDQARLRWLLPRFIASKFWEGCAGLNVTDEIRVTIASQACLLVLGFNGYCFEDCKTILVYPGGYLGVEEDPFGTESDIAHRLGEAHRSGPVVLSWWHACWDGRHLGDTNLVLHEFAHKLAERGDRRQGIPPLDNPADTPRWKSVIGKEYEQLVEDAAYQRPTLLDPYGAKSRTEFFAVASECFFLHPREMRRRHSELFQLLAEWYRQDPAQWRSDSLADAQADEAHVQYFRHAIAECDTALRRYPDRFKTHWHRASCYESLGEFDKALVDYTRLLQLVPKSERADAYYARGRAQGACEDYELAIADFSEAIRRRPDFAEAYRERGAARALRGEHVQAIADLNRALQLDARDDAAYLERGRVWCELHKYHRAVRDLTRAQRLCPHRAETYHQRALAYLSQRQCDRALADCNEALRLDPDWIEAYHTRAAVYETMGDVERAKHDRDEATLRDK